MPDVLQLVIGFLTNALVRFRRWLTVRRVLHIVAILFILLFLKEFVALDAVPFLFGLDLGLVLEVSALMIVLSARAHMIATFQIVREKLTPAKTGLTRLFQRGTSRALRTRSRTPRIPPSSSDSDGAAWTFA